MHGCQELDKDRNRQEKMCIRDRSFGLQCTVYIAVPGVSDGCNKQGGAGIIAKVPQCGV